MLALPAHLGGIPVMNPIKVSNNEFSASLRVTRYRLESILHQEEAIYTCEIIAQQISVKSEVHLLRHQRSSSIPSNPRQNLLVEL